MDSDDDVIICSESSDESDSGSIFGLNEVFDQNKENDEVKSFEVLDSDGIIKELNTRIADVENLTGYSRGICTIILAKFQWNEASLFEKYEQYNGGDGFLKECNVLRITSAAPTTGECQICFCDQKLIKFSCGHGFCRDCWQGNLKSNIIDDKVWQVPCMESKCGGILTEEIVRSLFDDDQVFNEYKKLAAYSFIQVDDRVKWCPGKDCGRAIRINDSESPGVKCSCNESFCVGCDTENHDPIGCKRLEYWLKKCGEDNETIKWLGQHSKKCPKCKTPIEKNGGCNHMTCRSTGCRYEFCWICMGPWTNHRACNRPEVNPQDAQSDADLEVYFHYSQRFGNHKNSIKLEKQLKTNVANKIGQMKSIYEATAGDVKFLEKAISTLSECRRTLMYTYSFAYFIQPNHQKTIFEDNQQKLESNVEGLSNLLENEFPYDVEKLRTWKQKVIDNSKHVETLQTALLNHVKEGNKRSYWEYKQGSSAS